MQGSHVMWIIPTEDLPSKTSLGLSTDIAFAPASRQSCLLAKKHEAPGEEAEEDQEAACAAKQYWYCYAHTQHVILTIWALDRYRLILINHRYGLGCSYLVWHCC